ncbi:hypothetical protein DLAC_08387 [Tieghemostelium lacteum]|uniref:Uncharacterized protein n=1 Tax=Tieghemostelium lacteum TaxID=361077 RepID=A0A151ZBV1_TIELA|nr:hypothetical protein DLAC_08387 [Tieghemostelium lacteum]|eukprot:KYQ91422.1 hypothetical protein DLAC_08387 [Tieghemostelium lacteum]
MDITPFLSSFRNNKDLNFCGDHFAGYSQFIGIESLIQLENIEKLRIAKYKVPKDSIKKLLENTKVSKMFIDYVIYTSIDTVTEDTNDILSSIIISKTIELLEYNMACSNVSAESYVQFLNHNNHLKSLYSSSITLISTSGKIENLYITNTSLNYISLDNYLIQIGIEISLYSLWKCQSNLIHIDILETNTPINQLMSLHPKCSYIFAYNTKYQYEQHLIDLINLNLHHVTKIHLEVTKLPLTAIIESITSRNQYLQRININCEIECNLVCQLVRTNLPTLISIDVRLKDPRSLNITIYGNVTSFVYCSILRQVT